MPQPSSLHQIPPAPLPAILPEATAPGVIVAIPAREAAEIGACLMALARQRNAHGLRLAPGSFGVVLLVHESRDATASLARALAPRLPFPLLVREATGPGLARRMALDLAADWLGRAARPDGVILATDAAARPDSGWVAANLAAIDNGADAVAGCVRPLEGTTEGPAEGYALLLQALAARLDPEPCDPWPRHGCEDRASLAITLHALNRLGRLPPCREDMAATLLDALRRQDARIRHAPEVLVRAPSRPPAALEPLAPAVRRLRARAALRQFWRDGTGSAEPETPAFRRWAARLRLPAGELGRMLGAPCFGSAWAAVQEASPALAPRPLAPAALPAAMLGARLALAALHRVRPGSGCAQAAGWAGPVGG